MLRDEYARFVTRGEWMLMLVRPAMFPGRMLVRVPTLPPMMFAVGRLRTVVRLFTTPMVGRDQLRLATVGLQPPMRVLLIVVDRLPPRRNSLLATDDQLRVVPIEGRSHVVVRAAGLQPRWVV